MNLRYCAGATLPDCARAFLGGTVWRVAAAEPLAGDASARRYFRLHNDKETAVLMDASRNRESVAPFVHISRHLLQLGLRAPIVLACDEANGLALLEDFGDGDFARLLERGRDPETLFALATDVLIALHQHPQAVPPGLRTYNPEKMLEDLELYLDWRAPAITEEGRAAFRAVWRETLPLAHRVPASLLLRDYHVANLMLLPDREGVQQVGLLDFQDAYQGPVTYDLVSLLEDARHDLPKGLEEQMLARYLAHFPTLDRSAFETSLAILAALRHTRVLGIFEQLSRREGRHAYKRLHSPRVERLLQRALSHPSLAEVKRWFEEHAL